jgi:Leu/Phe-tRNA-protein transferase
MRNPWSVLLLAFFSCCLTLSCEKEPASVRASRELQQMEAAYSTGVFRQAESPNGVFWTCWLPKRKAELWGTTAFLAWR